MFKSNGFTHDGSCCMIDNVRMIAHAGIIAPVSGKEQLRMKFTASEDAFRAFAGQCHSWLFVLFTTKIIKK